MLEAPAQSVGKKLEGTNESNTPPGGGDEEDEAPPPMTPGKNGTMFGGYVRCTECRRATNRYHDLCHQAYCRRCVKQHKLGCKPKLRCSMVACAIDGERCGACHSPFCEEHTVDNDCGNTTATGTEPERQVAVSPGKGRRLEEADEEDEDDELRAAREEAQRQ